MEVQGVDPVGQTKRVASYQEWYGAERWNQSDLSATRVGAPPKSQGTGLPTDADRFKRQLQEQLQAFDARLVFRVDDASGKLVAEVRDRETDELLRQIPPEYMMRIARVITEYLGLLVDERR